MTQGVKDYLAALALLPPGTTTTQEEKKSVPPPKNPPLHETDIRLPLGGGNGTTIIQNPVYISDLLVDATPDEHALLVALARRDRRKKGGVEV
jgi:hypothetical protein